MEVSMNTTAIQKMEIVQELSLLHDHRNQLENVRAYIQTILIEAKTVKSNRSLAVFGKTEDLNGFPISESAIKETRKELNDSILKRKQHAIFA